MNSVFFVFGAILLLFFAFSSISILFDKIRNSEYDTTNLEPIFQNDFIPNGDMLANYWLLQRAGVCEELKLVPALFIRWALQGYFEVEGREGEEGITEETVLYIKCSGIYGDPVEGKLFDMLLKAANGHSEITLQSFYNWLNHNGRCILQWYNELEPITRERAVKFGYLLRSWWLGRCRLTVHGQRTLRELFSFKCFFSRSLQEIRENCSFAVWNEYVFYAALFNTLVENRDLLEATFPKHHAHFSPLWKNILVANSLGSAVNVAIIKNIAVSKRIEHASVGFDGVYIGGVGKKSGKL